MRKKLQLFGGLVSGVLLCGCSTTFDAQDREKLHQVEGLLWIRDRSAMEEAKAIEEELSAKYPRNQRVRQLEPNIDRVERGYGIRAKDHARYRESALRYIPTINAFSMETQGAGGEGS